MAEVNTQGIKDPKDIKGDKDEYDPRGKRELIKTLLIIFLAILLVLTFFSNTIMNKSLAQISTERTTSGKLTERLRGSGMVESNQTYGVSVNGNKTIDTIMVKVGQEVKKDDVLFTVGTGESAELTTLEDQLSTLELAYQKALLTPPADYSSENQAIKNAREDLNAAIAKRDSYYANQGNVQTAKDNLKYYKSQLSYYTKLSTKLTQAISAIDMDEYSTAPAEYVGDLLAKKNEVATAQNEYQNAQTIYTALYGSASSSMDGDDSISGMPSMGRNASATASQEEIDAAKADMEEKKAHYNEIKAEYDSMKFDYRSDWASQLADAEDNVERYTGYIDDASSDGSDSITSIDMINDEIQAKQRALEDLIAALNKAQKDDKTQTDMNNLDLNAQKKEIDKLKKKVDKLKSENETTEIKSKYSGVVSSINQKAGDETVPGSDVMVIDIAEEGYTVKITEDAEKVKKIKKGVSAEIVNNWTGNVQAVLTDIKNDTTPNSKKRILVFNVTGDIESGSYVDLSIPCGSGTYDAIVPKSAVNTDKDGDFVLTVTSKSSPLGNRYYATRVPVEVTAKDEVSCAVSGSISNGDYVITAASKPVSPGDQVRMKDE